MTFLDKLEQDFADMKAWMIKEFGDHMSIHSAVSDLKAKTLEHVANHFGEDVATEEEGKDAPAPTASISSESSILPSDDKSAT